VLIIINILTMVLPDKNLIILDTDMNTDDVAALAILHTYADRGNVTILATVASNRFDNVAAVMSAFNTYFKRPDIPIGVPKGKSVEIPDPEHWSEVIRTQYEHHIKNNSEAADSVSVYREVLAKQPDRSVTIISIGFLTNLANLLSTSADSHSQLNGLDLVKQKVKQLVSMAGEYPSGREWNIYQDSSSAKKVYDLWPTPVIFSGFEIGDKVKTGLPLIHNNSLINSPIKDVFNICLTFTNETISGMSSWDETTVMVAVEGYEHYYNIESGRIVVKSDGSNSWDKNSKQMAYLVEKSPPSDIAKHLNELMMR